MSRLTKGIRNKRYRVKTPGSVKLHIEGKSGERFQLQLEDCSITGMAATVASKIDLNELHEGFIIEASKLVWEEGEAYLGRILIKRLQDKGDRTDFGFSSIDNKVPVTGTLSQFLDLNLDQAHNAFDYELSPDAFNLAHFVENEFTNSDLFHRMDEFKIFLDEWSKTDKFGYNNLRVASKGSRITLDRKRKQGRTDYIMMASNDYLGLASHPEVISAAKEALDKYGFGSTGSPITTGQTDLHAMLARQLADMHGRESALLYNSGYAANVGIIPAITAPNDLVVADALCHASIQDAMQMSRATCRFFKHNDLDHLDKILSRERKNHSGCLVVTEGVFSMDGDLAELKGIYDLSRKYNARIMVDQAHCFGVVGPKGLGICDKHDLLQKVDIIMGTFSKIAGGIGGFVVGSEALTSWLRGLSRSQFFSVSLPPSTVAAVSKSLEIFSKTPVLREKLHNNIKHFVAGVRDLGCSIPLNHESAVIPVIIRDEKKLGLIYQSLLDDGVLVTPIVYPAVSRKNCRFRFTMMATHELSEIDYVLMCFEKAMAKANFRFEDYETDKSALKNAA